MEQYLLGATEAKALPHIESGDPSVSFGSAIFMSRAHCEAFVKEKCAWGVLLLLWLAGCWWRLGFVAAFPSDRTLTKPTHSTTHCADEDGMEGLEADREERKQKARDNRATVLVRVP